MQPVSTAYKTQMKKSIRNRSFVRVSYGVFNLSAKIQAQFADNGHTNYSQLTINDDVLPDKQYATLERNYWRADGTQRILPAVGPYGYTGYVSDVLSGGNNTFTANPIITIQFTDTQDIYGLTFIFEDYSKEIKVNGTSYYPNSNEYTMPDKLVGVTEITIEFVKSFAAGRRIRLNRIQFGQIVSFGNKELIKTSYATSVDFVSLTLTKKSLAFVIDNMNQLYNPLNPQGMTAFMDERQPIEIDYGYTLDDGSVEWIVGDNLVLESAPVVAGDQATFTAVDNLSNLTGMFSHGLYRPSGITLYDLAEEVLTDAGVEHYIIDEHLRSVITKAALPVATHRECLQIIANAGQCILYTDRTGAIKLEIALDPTIRIYDNGHVVFSDSDSAYNDSELPTQKYIDFLPNSWRGDKVILPDNGNYMRTGFVSDRICDSTGLFAIYPVYGWTYSFPYSVFQIPITFDNIDSEYATEFDVVYKANGVEIDRLNVVNNSVNYTVEHAVSGITSVEIEIHKWSVGTRRAIINQIGGGRVNDMNIDFGTATDKPTVTKLALAKSVEVLCYIYTPESAAAELYKADMILSGEITLNISHDASTEITTSVTGGTITSESHYTYYSTVTLTGAGSATLILSGKKLTNSSISVIKEINPKGETKTPLQNPLITDVTNAQNTAIWLADYFFKRNQLTTDYRGNPELDAHDLIYMESQFQSLFPARIMEHKIEFDGSLKGSVKAVVM